MDFRRVCSLWRPQTRRQTKTASLLHDAVSGALSTRGKGAKGERRIFGFHLIEWSE